MRVCVYCRDKYKDCTNIQNFLSDNSSWFFQRELGIGTKVEVP